MIYYELLWLLNPLIWIWITITIYNPLIWIWRTHGYYDYLLWWWPDPLNGCEVHTLDAMHGRIQGALEHRPGRVGCLVCLAQGGAVELQSTSHHRHIYITIYIYTCTTCILLVCKRILLYIDTSIPPYHLISCTSSAPPFWDVLHPNLSLMIWAMGRIWAWIKLEG
jgi:hypothetical protein